MTERWTTITEYNHPDVPNTVTLVGNQHYGSAGYLQTLRDRMYSFTDSGRAIHYEGVRKLSEAEKANMPQDIANSYTALETILRVSGKVALAHGYLSMKDFITPQDSWENHDTSTIDLARRATFRQTFALIAIGGVLEVVEDKITAGVDFLDETKVKPSKVSKWAGDRVLSSVKPLIVDYRNTIALDAIDVATGNNPDQDIALLWGQGHIPGIAKGLSDRGYRLATIEEFDPAK